MAQWSDFKKDFSSLNESLIAFYRCDDNPSGVQPHSTPPNGNEAEVSDRVNGFDIEFFNKTENREYNPGIGSGLLGSDALVFHNTSGIAPLQSNTDAQYARALNQTSYLDFGPSSDFFGRSMTISMWVKFKQLATGSNLIKKSGNGTTVPSNVGQYSLLHSEASPATSSPEDNIYFNKFASSAGTIDANAFTGFIDTGLEQRGQSYNLETDKWYHIVAIYDRFAQFKPHQAGGCVYVIVNSAEAGSGAPGWDRIADARNFEEQGFLGGPCAQPDSALSSNMQNSNTEVWLGPVQQDNHDGDFSHVVIDKIGVWKRVLGSGEIKALFNDGNGIDLPFTTVAVSGSHGVGGYTKSKTPTDITASGVFGGLTWAPRQFGPSGTPNGVSPQFGGLAWAPRQWPVKNPNSGVSSGTASLGDTSSLSGYWTFNQASGDIRNDITGQRSLIPSPYKWEFKGDKSELNTGLSGYWPMDDWRLFRRQDVIGANHLAPNDADSNKVVTVPGSLSGAEVNRLNSAFYTRSSPTDSLNIASGDLTVAFWTESHIVELNLGQGYVSKWDPGSNLREWTLFRQANNASDTSSAGRMNFAVTDDATTNRLQIAASGDGTAPRLNNAGVPYFIAARFNVASGITNITVASGSNVGGTWDTRIFNQSDPEPQLQNGLASVNVPFRVGTGVGFEEIRGSIAGVGVWRKYLTDGELELLYGSGLGQKVKPIDNAISQLVPDHSEDPLGPNGDSTIKKLGTRSAEYNQEGGTGGGVTDYSMFKLEHGQGGEFFDFDGSISFTFAGWVRFNNTDTQVILAKNSAQDGQRGYMLRRNNNDGRIDWMMSNSAGTSFTALEISSTFTSANTWYFVICGWDKSSGKMFGSLNAGSIQEAAKASFGRSSAPFTFGQGNSNLTSLAPLKGRTDAWGLWSKRLSQAEIDSLYNSGDGIELSSSDLDLTFDPLFADYDEPGNKIGGFLFSKPGADQRNNAKFGGYTKAPGFEKADTFLGGLVFAQPLTSKPAENIGGIASGLNQFGPNDEQGILPKIGGWTFGRPAETSFIEQHSRTMVKVRSEDVVDQALDLDSQLILFDTDRQDFNAKLIAFSRTNADFNAKLNIQDVKTLPSSTLSIVSLTDINDVTQVEVIASGINNETNTFFTNATIDFGEPYGFGGSFGNGGFGNATVDSSISGFSRTTLQSTNNVASGIHNYVYPGKYIIVASFIDNLGQVTSNAFLLNTIVSGSIDSVSGTPVEGTDYPALDISGIPRQGLVPPSFDVDFQMRASGTGGPVGTAVNNLNKSNPQTNKHLSWNFNNGIMSTIKQPFSTYFNPGLYIPTARYQFIHPSGTLTSGVYSSKPIWISDSLVIGFGK